MNMTKTIISLVTILLLFGCTAPAVKNINMKHSPASTKQSARDLLKMGDLRVLFEMNRGEITIDRVFDTKWTKALEPFVKQKYDINAELLKNIEPSQITKISDPLYDCIRFEANGEFYPCYENYVHKGSLFSEDVISAPGLFIETMLLPITLPLSIIGKLTESPSENSIRVGEAASKLQINQAEVNRIGRLLNNLIVDEIKEAQTNRDALMIFVNKYPEANLRTSNFTTSTMLSFANDEYQKTEKNSLIALENFIKSYDLEWYSDNCYKPTSRSINVRKTPTISGKKIARLSSKDRFCSMIEKDGWLKLAIHRRNYGYGWVSKSVLKKSYSPVTNDQALIELNALVGNAKNARNRAIKKMAWEKSERTRKQKERIAKEKIRQRELKIERYRAKHTAEGYFQAYKITKDDSDVARMLMFFDKLPELESFLTPRPNLVGVSIVTNKLITLNRALKTPEGFYQAYRLTSEDIDIENMLTYIHTLPEIQSFLSSRIQLNKHSLVKRKQTLLYRSQNSFDGYINAYQITEEQYDIKKANKLARTTIQKRMVEELLIRKVKPGRIFDVTMTETIMDGDVTGGSDVIIAGSDIRGVKSLKIKYKISLRKDSPIPLKYGKYVVTVKGVLTGTLRVTMTMLFSITNSKQISDTAIGASVVSPFYKWEATGVLDFGEVMQSISGNILGIKLLDGEVSNMKLSSLKITSIKPIQQ